MLLDSSLYKIRSMPVQVAHSPSFPDLNGYSSPCQSLWPIVLTPSLPGRLRPFVLSIASSGGLVAKANQSGWQVTAQRHSHLVASFRAGAPTLKAAHSV
jgi:hypothetical protein